jgi:hypothetical protein
MHKILFLILFTVACTFSEYNQVYPREVQMMVDNYVKDSLAIYGFNRAKTLLQLDANLQATGISVGVPVLSHKFDLDSLDNASSEVPIESIIKSDGYWTFPILSNEKCIYCVYFETVESTLKYYGMGECSIEDKQIQQAFKEAGSIKPISIAYQKRTFIHFPSKGKYNLYYVNPNFQEDSYAPLINSNYLLKIDTSAFLNTSNYSQADSSQYVLKFIKEERVKMKKQRNSKLNNSLKGADLK